MTDFRCGEEYKVLLPRGKYEAQCIRYDIGIAFGKGRKLYLHFKIVEQGDHSGKEIFMAFNIPRDGKFRPGSKYYKTWVQVTGRRPSRNAEMSPRLFVNKIFRIKTRTAKPKQVNGKYMDKSFHYSVVDYIEEVIAG